MTPEAKLTRDIISKLTEMKRQGSPLWWLKVHGSPVQQAGIPDLIIFYDGCPIGMEVKAGNNEATPLQLETGRRIEKARGTFAVVRNVEEALDALDDAIEHAGRFFTRNPS